MVKAAMPVTNFAPRCRQLAHVAGLRNVVLSVAFMLNSLVSGAILKSVAFPTGYQIVFGIGFFGAAMGGLHLFYVRPLKKDRVPLFPPPVPVPDFAKVVANRKGSRAMRGSQECESHKRSKRKQINTRS